MRQLNENQLGQMLKQLAKHSDYSTKQLKKLLAAIPAATLINLKTAVDAGDMGQAKEILGTIKAEPGDTNLERVKTKLQSLERDKSIGTRTKVSKMMSLISELTPDDWLLVWPTLKQATLKTLWHQTSKQPAAVVGRKQADQILRHAKETLMEKLIYQNQIVEVQVPHGPNGTVGILLDHKLTMVPRSECKELNEHVLGMTGMPSLARMLMLAGVDTLPEAQDTVGQEHLPMGLRVVVEFSPEAPMDQTRVKILNVDSTITLEGLRARIRRQFKELSADMSSESPDYSFATANSKRLANSLETMQAALHDLQLIRQQGGARSRNIPQVLEDENN